MSFGFGKKPGANILENISMETEALLQRRKFLQAFSSAFFLSSVGISSANAGIFSFSKKKNDFDSDFTHCLGAPMANFFEDTLKAYDGTELVIRIALPIEIQGKLPIICCVPDQGLEANEYDLLSGALASLGYAVATIHSNKPKNETKPTYVRRRSTRLAEYTRFFMDNAEQFFNKIPSKPRIDFAQFGVTGHGEGAWTALELVGWGRGLVPDVSLADGRVKASFALMPPKFIPDAHDIPKRAKVIYGRAMIAGILDDLSDLPEGSGIIGLDLPTYSRGFGGLIGVKKGKETAEREILATACASSAMFFDWSLKNNKERLKALLSLDGYMIPNTGRAISLKRS